MTEPDDSGPSEPPAGYERVGPCGSAETSVRTVAAALLLLFALVGVVLGTFEHRFGRSVAAHVDATVGRGVGAAVEVLAAMSLAMVVVAVAHELLHWLVLRAFGYRPRVGYEATRLGPQPYVAVRDQLWSRGEHLVTSAAPLTISATGAAAMFLWSPPLALVGGLALAFNTPVAGADMWSVLVLLRLPRGTEFYSPGVGQFYAYVLADADVEAARRILGNG